MTRQLKIFEMRYAVTGLLGLGAFLAAAPPRAVAADPFAASVLSCAAEADRDKRLDCYDRAVANFTAGLSRASGGNAGVAVAPSAGVGVGAGVGRAGGESASAAAGAGARSAAPAQPAVNTAGQATAGTASQPAAGTSATGGAVSGAGGTPRHLTARVVSIDYLPDHMVLHLDNNQVWQQVSDASTELHFHVGDTVNIDKQMGSYWLSGRKGDGTVQVKQKQ